MLTPSAPVAPPLPFDQTNAAKAAVAQANARADFDTRLQLAKADEARIANLKAMASAARDAEAQVPDPMASLSTVAIAGALGSLPAALDMMQRIALASASGTLTDADRQTLQADYAQLTAKVAASVGPVGGGSEAQTSTSHDDEREDNAENTWREDSDDHRSTLTQTLEVPTEAVQYQPAERTVTTQTQTLVADGQGPRKDPQVDLRTHELHVGADSYEPASVRQSFTHTTTPATFGRLENYAQTQHLFVTQAAQVTRFVQVAQTEHVAPLVAVA